MLMRIKVACAFRSAMCLFGMASVLATAISLPAFADETPRTKPPLAKESSEQEFIDVKDLTQSDAPLSHCSFAPKPGRFRMKVTKGWTLKLPYMVEHEPVGWVLLNTQQVGARSGSKTPDNHEWSDFFPAREPVLEMSGGDINAMDFIAIRKGVATFKYYGEGKSDDPATFKICELQIVVESDTSEIDQAIKLAVPDAQVRVIEIRNSAAVLAGTATTEDAARVILQIGQQFYNEVIPQLKVLPATADSKSLDDSRTHKEKSKKNKRSEKHDVSEMKQLRNDVQSLRDEVSRLSELMEKRNNPPLSFVPPPDEAMPLESDRTTDLKNSNQILFFTATWCGPCQKMVPLIEKLKKQGLPIRAVDVDRNLDLAKQFNVETIPCFILVSKGVEVKRITGAQTEQVLKKFVEDIASARLKND